jgi:flagellar biosynthesis/type III secretory pathway chaperone
VINVRNAWEAIGIHPFNPKKVIAIIIEQKLSLVKNLIFKTSVSAWLIQRIYKKLEKEGHVNKNTKILLRVGEKLATKLEIVRYKNNNLRKAIIHEKKKRKCGKAMNLYNPDEKEG